MAKKSNTGFRNGDMFCFNCGGSHKMNLPLPVKEAAAIMKAFARLHLNCPKTWQEPISDGNGKSLQENMIWWLQHGEQGMSSKNMFYVLSGSQLKSDGELCHPLDPDDFKRCSQLLQAVPQWRTQLHKLKPISKTWSSLVDNWDKLEEMLVEARKLWAENKGAKEMYDFMKSLGC